MTDVADAEVVRADVGIITVVIHQTVHTPVVDLVTHVIRGVGAAKLETYADAVLALVSAAPAAAAGDGARATDGSGPAPGAADLNTRDDASIFS